MRTVGAYGNANRTLPLKTQLAAVVHGEHDGARAVETVEGEVAAAAEGDPLLPEIGIHAFRRPARLRVDFEQA